MNTVGPAPDSSRPRPRLVQVSFVLGDGTTIPYRAEMGEVLKFDHTEKLLEALRDRQWIGLEVIDW